MMLLLLKIFDRIFMENLLRSPGFEDSMFFLRDHRCHALEEQRLTKDSWKMFIYFQLRRGFIRKNYRKLKPRWPHDYKL